MGDKEVERERECVKREVQGKNEEGERAFEGGKEKNARRGWARRGQARRN